METSADLFTKRGYSSVGINEIIEKSGTAKASFYYHFPSKEDLCACWLAETHDDSVTRHEAILAQKKDPTQKLRDYFLSLKTWLESTGFRGCPYTNTAAGLDCDSPPIQSKVTAHKDSIARFFELLSYQIFDQSKEAKIFGETLFLLYSGATTEAQNSKSLQPLESAMRSLDRLLESELALVT